MTPGPRIFPRLAGLLLALALGLGSACSATPDTLRKAPYLLFTGDPTTMQVLWQAGTTRTCSIEWGPDTSCSGGRAETTEYGTDHQHRFTLTDLVPGKKYFYRVESEGTQYHGSFRAAPSPEASAVRFLAYGDTRTEPEAHNTVAGQMLQAAAADPALQSLVISVGDMVALGDSEQIWDDDFFSAKYPDIRRMMATLPFQSAMGNHEDAGFVFQKYFPYPHVADRYWSFDYGPAHFVMVDQYVSYAPGSPQYKWIQEDLAATPQPWRFVVLHEPGWSAKGGHANNIPVQRYLQPLFVKHGVSIVFGGHNHYYARAVVDGVQHLTIGGGGAPLYTPNPDAPNVVASARSHHFCRITIEGNRLGFAALNGTAVIDTFSLGLE